ncbi:hypothetical protein [Chromobacterium sp. Beijing]|nr:hypothetical protein [Chromobacterium sp. Beijing]
MLTLLRQNLEQLRREPQPEWPQLEHAFGASGKDAGAKIWWN